MHPRIQEVLDYLDSTRTDLSDAVQSVAADRRDQRPAADCWSVAEILDHLNIAERKTVKFITRALEAAKASGLAEETQTSSVLNTVPTAKIGDRTNRVTAPEAVLPRSDIDAASAWSALQESREKMRAVALAGDGLALGEVKQPHAALGLADLYQWMIFQGAHEARHTAQIREIAETFRS
jgi:hypothetical protein